MTILQLVYGLNTYDHVTCMHFHHPLDMIQVTMSVCLSVWAVLGRFSQSVPVPCGVFWGVGEGRAR